jgi:UDP-2-acetamido-3-amino-2,3-dideoxy-glucuronate N-acetyltransferase
VPDYALMLGVPARRKSWVCRCGATLPEVCKPVPAAIDCAACGNQYSLQADRLSPIREVQSP